MTYTNPLSYLMKTRPSQDCTLAAIDIGTNSIHMVVVKIDAQMSSFRIIAKEKDTVRLGDRDFNTGNLTEEAMDRSFRALKRCQDLAQSLQADQIIAVATSATREAPNGQDFIKQVKDKIGISIDLISGQEEARRIYLGVLSGMDFNGKMHSVIDIGGGSTEIILADNQDTRFLSSTKIGAVRLTREFIDSDPINDKDFLRLQGYIQGMLERPVDQLKQALGNDEKPIFVGTSGTAETLASIHYQQENKNEPLTLNGYQMSRNDIEDILQQLKKMDYEERISIGVMSERRAEIIIAGVTIMLEAMKMLQIDTLVVCERALREGIIVDWMLQHGYIDDRLAYQGEVRSRNIYKIAHKYQVNLAYAERTGQFALKIFNSTQKDIHNWGEEQQEYLWYAAILHNCGLYVSHSAHHKHSYYLIRHGELLGFSEPEIELIAQIARYHRKSKPKRKHEAYAALSDEHRKMVKQLSAILRLAIALDRRQIGAIKDLECKFDQEYQQLHLHLFPRYLGDDCALELWSLEFKKPIFEQEFHLKLFTTLHK